MKTISYQKKYNKRARHIRVSVYPDESVVVTVPRGASDSEVDKFISEKQNWIDKHIQDFRNSARVSYPFSGRRSYLKYREQARKIITDKTEKIANQFGFSYKKIFIKNQKSRWGSCSSSGNLNFNFKILFLPERLQDYIIIHELCHLKELNHSKKYWTYVAEICPNYKLFEKELRKSYKL